MSKYAHKFVDTKKNVTFFAFSDGRQNPFSGKGSVTTSNYHGAAPVSGAQADDIPRLKYSAMKEEGEAEESAKKDKDTEEKKETKKASIQTLANFVRHLAKMPAVAPAEKDEAPATVEEGKEGARFIHVYAPKDKGHVEFVLSDSKSEKPVKKTMTLTSVERPGRMVGAAVEYIKKNLGKLLEGTDIPTEDLDTLTLFQDKQTGIPVIVYAKGKVTNDVVGRGNWIKSVSSPVLTKKVEKGEGSGFKVRKLSTAETARELAVAIVNAEQGV